MEVPTHTFIVPLRNSRVRRDPRTLTYQGVFNERKEEGREVKRIEREGRREERKGSREGSGTVDPIDKETEVGGKYRQLISN